MRSGLSLGEYIRQLNNEHSRHRKKTVLTSVLALFVMSFVIWGLRVKGISLTNDTDCGIEEHIHNEECYTNYRICGLDEGDILEDGTIHVHSQECYEQELICEHSEHVHTIECFNIEDDALETEEEQVILASEELTDASDISESEDETNEIINLNADDNMQDNPKTVISYSAKSVMQTGRMKKFLAPPTPTPEEELTEEKIEQYIREYAANNTVVPGRIYVITATGVRDKDYIHEYLPDACGDSNQYGDKYHDGYLGNANHHDLEYELHLGLPLYLCAYRSDNMQNVGFYSSDSSVISTDDTTLNISGNGFSSVVYTEVNPLNYNNRYQNIQFRNNNWYVYDTFYLHIRENERRDYDHADIEITDGGFFKITTKRTFSDGTYQEIVTKYNSFVSEVASCKLYKDENENQVAEYFESSDYEPKHEAGQTQYELTSKYRCMGRKGFAVAELDHAIFELELSLAPETSIITLYEDDTKAKVLGSDTKSFANDDGTFNYEVKPIKVRMGKTSILDALNKCPNHSGLDFNLLYSEINLNSVQPTDAVIEVKKNLLGTGLAYEDFEFEIIDEDGNIVLDKDGNPIKVSPDSSTGIARFPVLDCPIPGLYKYKIREVFDRNSGGIELPNDKYYYNGIIYDAKEIDVEINVVADPSVEDIIKDPTKNDDDAHLEATISYYYKGDKLAENEIPEFTNEAAPESETKALKVMKVWKGTALDNISFRIIQTKNGTEDSFYTDSDGSSIFMLNASNSWQKTFEDLPVKVGDNEYTYRVKETEIPGYSPSYSMDEYDDRIEFTITNTNDADKKLYIEKVWQDEDGNELDVSDPDVISEYGIDVVDFKLKRRYREIEIPVMVYLKAKNASNYSQSFQLDGYKGSTVSFKLKDQSGAYKQLGISTSSTSCSCSFGNDVYTVSNINNGATVILEYDAVSSSDLYLWHTNGTGFALGSDDTEPSKWSVTNGQLVGATTLCNSGNDSPVAYKFRNRNYDNGEARLRLSTAEYYPGNYYSFSAYVMWNNVHTDQNNSQNGTSVTAPMLKLMLKYDDSGGTTHYADIDKTVANPTAKEWYHLANDNFKIPSGAKNVYLVIGTGAQAGNWAAYPDIYIDDVIVAGRGVTPYVDNYKNLSGMRTYELTNPKTQVPASATNWAEDSSFSENFTLGTSGNWIKTYDSIKTTLGELPNREYEYYIEEQRGSDSLFRVTYENDHVAYNTSDRPITAVNCYSTFRLPNTGGGGTNRIRWLGIIIISFGVFAIILRRQSKYRHSG